LSIVRINQGNIQVVSVNNRVQVPTQTKKNKKFGSVLGGGAG
jgi:hypothetical protein